MSRRTYELLLLSASTPDALESATARLAEHLATQPDSQLGDVAFTLQAGRLDFDHRRMLVAHDASETVSALSNPGGSGVLTVEQPQRGRAVAFMFPGVGDHYPGMARDLYHSAPAFRDAFDRCAGIIQDNTGEDPRSLLFDTADSAAAPDDGERFDFRSMVGRSAAPATSTLNETRLAQPIVYAVDYAMSEMLASFGIRPTAVIGYSLGEYVAATLAGILSMTDALTLVCQRAALIQRQTCGAMMAVASSEAEIVDLLPAGLDLAIVNGDRAVVIAGPVDLVHDFRVRLERQGIACRVLDTTHAFHSRQLDAAAPALTELVGTFALRAPQIPIVSNLTGNWLTAAQARDPAYWARHMCGTVQFARGLETLLASRDTILLEVGPGQTLGSFAKQHPRTGADRIGSIHSTLPGVHVRQSDLAFFLTALGRLWLGGVDVDFAAARAAEGRRRTWLPINPAGSPTNPPKPLDETRAADRANRRHRRRLSLHQSQC